MCTEQAELGPPVCPGAAGAGQGAGVSDGEGQAGLLGKEGKARVGLSAGGAAGEDHQVWGGLGDQLVCAYPRRRQLGRERMQDQLPVALRAEAQLLEPAAASPLPGCRILQIPNVVFS